MITGKRIGITGHCTGIGKAIWEKLLPGNELVGFSRTNGHDLTNEEIFKNAVNVLNGCDIVINNAYSYDYRFLQTDILNHFIDAHLYDSSRCIVTVGSMSKYVIKSNNFNRYASSKVLIDDTMARVKSASGHRCGLIVISPNWVETAMAEKYRKTNPEDFAKIAALTPEEVADQVEMLIGLFYEKNINIYEYEIKKLAR